MTDTCPVHGAPDPKRRRRSDCTCPGDPIAAQFKKTLREHQAWRLGLELEDFEFLEGYEPDDSPASDPKPEIMSGNTAVQPDLKPESTAAPYGPFRAYIGAVLDRQNRKKK